MLGLKNLTQLNSCIYNIKGLGVLNSSNVNLIKY